jgi:hypothetical protein
MAAASDTTQIAASVRDADIALLSVARQKRRF